MAARLLETSWPWQVLRGVLAIVFGVVAMVWPISTVVALAILWGVWALADGASALSQALQPGDRRTRLALAVMGLLALAAAFLAIFSPALTAVALTWILGIWLIVRGALEVVLAVVATGQISRWGMLLSAAVDIALGVLFAANPGRAAVGIAFVLGLTALAWGLVLVGMGLATRRRMVAGAPAATHA